MYFDYAQHKHSLRSFQDLKQKGFSLVIILVAVVILAGLIYGGYSYFNQQRIKNINSFEECAKYYPVMESYPAQCNAPDGKHFVQELSDEEKKKLVPPTSIDETADWKTYVNNEGNYQFGYPDNFELHLNEAHVFETDKYTPAENYMELNSPEAGVVPFITISHEQVENMTIEEFIDKKTTCTSITSSNGKNIQIDGFEAKFYENTPCGVAGTTEAYVINNGLGYVITFNGESDTVFVSNFLGTFKFLK